MRANHRQKRQSGAYLIEHLLPYCAGLLAVEAGVDGDPTLFMAQQIQVDVVEGEGQRHAQPQHPGRHLANLAVGRRLRPGKPQPGAPFVALSVEFSHAHHLRRLVDHCE
ncbi:hypothetical protein D3C85_708470 [compost metagenome]